MGSNYFEIKDAFIQGKEVVEAVQMNRPIQLSAEVIANVTKSRKYLIDRLKNNPDEVIYGINTGFGVLCDVRVSQDDLESLQSNLVRSHSCGAGDRLDIPKTRLIHLLKIISLSKGNSAISIELLEKLVELYNKEIVPEVFQKGSLGASGDLAPLAHFSLVLIGEGNAFYKGKWRKTEDLVKENVFQPITLGAKEGLALLNGTQYMCALGWHSINKAQRLLHVANASAGISLEAYEALDSPFNELIHKARNHKGQIKIAEEIRRIRKGRKAEPAEHVQDPYSMRCIPQVHGAILEVLEHVQGIFENELNAVTDNPLIFMEEEEVLSGGNFHGQPLAMAMDYLAIALSELGSISERRTFLLLSGKRNLPNCLASMPGLQSGFMIAQYTAASLANENKTFCFPASADSITSANGQEDHVSMGATSANKLVRILDNLEDILSIEWFCAMQGIDFKNIASIAPQVSQWHKQYRLEIPFLSEDSVLQTKFRATKEFIEGLNFNNI